MATAVAAKRTDWPDTPDAFAHPFTKGTLSRPESCQKRSAGEPAPALQKCSDFAGPQLPKSPVLSHMHCLSGAAFWTQKPLLHIHQLGAQLHGVFC